MEIGFSPCPNDTFTFYALVHGKVPAPDPVRPVLEDVETLNRWALEGRLPLTKLSYAAYARVRDRYVALRSGGALGRARRPLKSLKGARVAVPGRNTTAFLLLSLYAEDFLPVEVRYDQIMPLVARGEVEAGLIIHESRFTYPEYGLGKVLDLGEWWEGWTGYLGKNLEARPATPFGGHPGPEGVGRGGDPGLGRGGAREPRVRPRPSGKDPPLPKGPRPRAFRGGHLGPCQDLCERLFLGRGEGGGGRGAAAFPGGRGPGDPSCLEPTPVSLSHPPGP